MGQGIEATSLSLEELNAISQTAPGFDGWITGLQGVAGSAQGAADANLNLVQSFADVTAASLAATGLEELNAAREAGLISQDEYEEGVRTLGGELLDLSPAQLEAITMQSRFKGATGQSKDAVMAEVEALKKLWEWLQKVSTGGAAALTTPMHGAQHGMNMTVPPGFDRDNFMIGVSSGERVKVTPAGRSAPPEAAAGGNSFVFNTQVSSDIQGMALLEKMRDAVRGVV